jgi:hypothetical protein
VFDKPGEFMVRVKFDARVRQSNGWNHIDFNVAPAALKPLALQGLAADTQFQFAGAARMERQGADFISHLPADGAVALSWKQAKPESEGKLFFSAEALAQVTVSPGLMRQTTLLEGRVMQGEMTRLVLLLRGIGEVTRVAGEPVLSWSVEPVPGATDRRLVVQFNQPQKEGFLLQLQTQTALGAFPQALEPVRAWPEGATRYAGYVRLANEGAVRLEVVQSTGLSQVSPEQFPETDQTRALFRAAGGQRFAFRFSGAEHGLRLQADNILPEFSVSQILSCHFGETELSVDAELELDIREAPLRELVLNVPKGYALSRLTASGLSDYFLRETEASPEAELRLVFGTPVSGRQLAQLRLERNKPLTNDTWTVPRIEVVKAKSTRGHLGVSADAGFRLTPERTQSLTEVATAFFPKKLANLQSAFRITEASWQATMRVERLPQTVQADALHLFSIGEGIAYGSSVLNFLVSGAPVSTLKIELSGEYFNVEFIGKDIRNWQTNEGGYQVQLHTPVSGAYTLLATYERPFNRQGDTLAFTGARPLDARTEQGHTVVVSAFQYQVRPVEITPALLPLEPGEVPAEYRLFFDAPVLAAYRYSSRPFSLRLALSPLAQAETLGQVVDRAVLTTRVSKQGQVLTTARYFVKNRGQPHFSLTLPEGTDLWSATVNGAATVPVKDGKANLIPLPQRAAPGSGLDIELKLASRPKDPARIKLETPVAAVPVLLAEWQIEPDARQRLIYQGGSLTPIGGVADASGFAQLARTFTGGRAGEAWGWTGAALASLFLVRLFWRWALGTGVHRWSARHVMGGLLGVIALVLVAVFLVWVGETAAGEKQAMTRGLSFVAPVQQAGAGLALEVDNVSDEFSLLRSVGLSWPAVVALLVWGYATISLSGGRRRMAWSLGWLLLAWAILRWPNGVPVLLAMMGGFLLVHLVVPGLWRLAQVPVKPIVPPASGAGVATAAVLLMLAAISVSAAPREPLLAEWVNQEARVEDRYVSVEARIRWQAEKGQLLPILFEPAVLTRLECPTNVAQMVQSGAESPRALALRAMETGLVEARVWYQVQVSKRDNENGFSLPTQYGLVNKLRLVFPDLDVEAWSPQAVSAQRETTTAGTNKTVANLVLTPVNEAWIGWKPRSRDLKREKAVFFAEIQHLYVPAAGVVEGVHHVLVRPAQGELTELTFDVPGGATITDVIEPGRHAATVDAKNVKAPGTLSSMVSVWRFDPDTRKLRVSLSPAQSRPFLIQVRSQLATGPLPLEQAVGPITIQGAAGQLGVVGLATSSEVQLDSATAESFSAINLEDYPAAALEPLRPQFAGLTVRRAYRYSEQPGTLTFKASAVDPDVRAETQETLSLGEDRTVLAVNLTVNITRAGIFKLSFLLPAGLDVESVSGQALSHWTELKTDAGRAITLHLRGKTEGQQTFALSLAGPGLKPVQGWSVPKFTVREAGKQMGQLVIVPEQGMRLQVNNRDAITQLDPQRVGVRQQGVLAFRLLQNQWKLALDVEQVDPWVQVTSLQHASVSEAQVKVTANLQYQIENTGLKSLVVSLPTNAENVVLSGDQVADFLPRTGAAQGGMREWEVKLHRRVIGRYVLSAAYQVRLPEGAAEMALRGIQAVGVNLQRGFLTLQSAGRLQLRVPSIPASLQASEWQTVPRALRQNMQAEAASYTFRLVEPAFLLPLQVERHEAAKLLEARVNRITLTSALSDDGDMLTQVQLDLIPGDKRLLQLTLPPEANFWFSFVNQNGAAPWREKERILIPLDQRGRVGQTMTVEFLYSSRVGSRPFGSLNLQLAGPKFDLPLENITWQVYLNEKWKLKDWSGSLQLRDEKLAFQTTATTLGTYLEKEAALRRDKTNDAAQMLARGNTLIQEGDPQQARWAFEAAYGLSTQDDAFNEDARVLLHNLKLQQALVGLNFRQAGLAPEGGLAGKLRDIKGRKDLAYTQQEARQILDNNSSEENKALMRLAERLIQQQEAAVVNPGAIRATIPQQGRLLTFTRAVQVDPFTELQLGLKASAVQAAPFLARLAVLASLLLFFSLVAWATSRLHRA